MTDTRVLSRVGMPKAGDDAEIPFRSGWFGDLIKSDLMPRFFENVARGCAFMYPSAAAGVALAAAGNNQPTIWNPAGSGVLFVPLRVILGYVSTTHAAGHVAWAFQSNVGAALGTAAPMSVFTDIAPINCLIGGGRKSKVRFATTVTFTAAPTYLRPAGPSFLAATAAAVVDINDKKFDEDGALVLPPGNALQLCANGAVAGVYASCIIGLELPLPPGFDG